MGFLDKAKKFLQKKGERKQAFLDREHELKTNIADLDAKKSEIIANYDPLKPFDPKKIDELDAQIEAAEKEIFVLNQTKKDTPDYDFGEVAPHIETVKDEASKVIDGKKAEEEKAREAIAEAKKVYLDSLVAHYRLKNEINEVVSEANETLSQLTQPIGREADKLRRKAQELDLELYRLAPTGSVSMGGGRSDQWKIDELEKQKSDLWAQIHKLEGYKTNISGHIPELSSHRNGDYQRIYFIADDEQKDAATKGILK
ncbi:hypothetical protein M948_19375 [Virgibacillus sp. CM-4]|uniref:hypothetical protein n=1 Tax=Virgibacillus sp. CM-4 TaxID=1354277 RepID=UPI0003889075|nr:hypothetical protein [Virgibacillus sp. CM-4]EQB35262.1 hypothetical protein M948_19375 [Virgibacillus sp. CM-4]